MKDKIKLLHKKHPYFEPLAVFVLGNVSALFLSLFGRTDKGDILVAWYFLGFIICIIIGVIYYIFFSSYHFNSEEAKLNQFAEDIQKIVLSKAENTDDPYVVLDIYKEVIKVEDYRSQLQL